MLLTNMSTTNLSFAKHETFHIREGWLFKGLSAIKEAEDQQKPPSIFLDKDAPEHLGIGRNMVKSLRFWMQATGLSVEKLEGQSVQRLTEFGQLVWQHDLYLEYEGTLWLLHYHLACSHGLASSWYWFFNHFSPRSFTDDEVVEALQQWTITQEPDRTIAISSLKKDIACLLRTYCRLEDTKTPEDLIISPLTSLHVLNFFEEKHQRFYYRLQMNSEQFSPLIMLFVLIDQQQKKRPGVREVKLNQVLQEPMNVGRVFNLSTIGLADLIALLNKEHPDLAIRFVRTGGLDQLMLPQTTALAVLKRYYEEQGLN